MPDAHPASPESRERVSGCVLITRPQPGGDATARLVAALGWRPLVAPALRIAATVDRLPAPERVQAVLATSANALSGRLAGFASVPLFAVGDATGATARAAGFRDVRSAAADAVALAALVGRDGVASGRPLLLLSGAGQGLDLAAALRAGGFRVIRRCVYATAPVGRLPVAARRALAGNDVASALFFSAATARAFVSLLRRTMGDDVVCGVDALAISQPTATALAALPWRRIRVASLPNQDELLAML